MQPRKLFSGLTFLLLLGNIANASAYWYQIEMIVFEHLYPDTGNEQWYNNHGLPDIANSIELVTDQQGEGIAYKVLSPSRYQISGVYSALKSSKEYRPIMHIAWQQPGLSRSQARPVHIRKTDGDVYSSDSLNNNLVKIDGTVQLRGGHFLYLDIDLAYFLQALPESQINSAFPAEKIIEKLADYTRLVESRKIKLNELHYFDHPLFGVITWVRRLSQE